MYLLMIILFILGYIAIATEHQIHVNKAATALIMCSVLWTLYIFYAQSLIPPISDPELMLHAKEEVIKEVTGSQLIEGVGEVAEILFFLMGAMTIVELIDVHGGFNIITRRITTKNKKKLLFILSGITFVMSAVLDNLTTTIVIVMLLRKLIQDQKERWYFAAVVILAANAGGAFSPIGDVTTIMLWVKGNVTTSHLIPELILPSLAAAVIPMLIMSRKLKGTLVEPNNVAIESHEPSAAEMVTNRERNIIFYLGIGALVFVPIFKAITHLPPYIGVSLGLGVLWVYTELMYHGKGDSIKEEKKARIQKVVKRIDMTTILFFLGILMAVNALSCAGILTDLSTWLDSKIGNIYAINIIIGILSSIVDNVPLVAGAMKMYAVDPSVADFAVDGSFWLFLAYCAGVGGSILIVGSAAGVVVMGLEKVSFGWYLKEVSLIALLGYLAGAAIFIFQNMVILPMFN